MANYVQRETKTITATYTLLDTDDVILADTTAGEFTITVPEVSSSGIQKTYLVIHIGSDATLTVQVSGSDLINGGTSVVSSDENQTFSLISTHTANWSALSNISITINERDFMFDNNLDTVREQFLTGSITIISAVLSAGLSSVEYQTTTDNGTNYTTQADLTELQNWIDTNISGSITNGTDWQLKVIATFNTSETKSQNLKLIY